MGNCKISLKNIKMYRKIRRYSQLRLAEEIGTSAATISRLENDREKAPKLDVIEKIGDVLDVCPFDLMSCSCIRKKKNGCKNCEKKRERAKEL
ncbi:helix-turn-helix domain-containing protein [Clostridium perfringens]|jgi:transcriptional regulator with XRE-family HTH domain|uniref:Helix-turn-helix transcriptional regulator n=1 Tax=Clostridium perfringens TaxID=1502 RepID=A0AAW4J6J6_CLOPF|nr:helix-turn-helix transcriptional regulator [Clostridium perfringens]MBO3356140.1 helix-turn-helix transcriptional regulator [Clostridium perfringens]MBO3359519.1 helix-turn-helix transcriptional regulator [Clostridium perfringens]